MPTYDYQCQSCGHRWELFQKMTNRPVKKCPACKKQKAQRLLSAGGGFLFKGSGFHITDYRPESYKKAATADQTARAASAPAAPATAGGTPAPVSAAKEKKSSAKKSSEKNKS